MRKFLPVLVLALIFGALYYFRQHGNEIVTPDRPSQDSPADPGATPPAVVPSGEGATSGSITGIRRGSGRPL